MGIHKWFKGEVERREQSRNFAACTLNYELVIPFISSVQPQFKLTDWKKICLFYPINHLFTLIVHFVGYNEIICEHAEFTLNKLFFILSQVFSQSVARGHWFCPKLYPEKQKKHFLWMITKSALGCKRFFFISGNWKWNGNGFNGSDRTMPSLGCFSWIFAWGVLNGDVWNVMLCIYDIPSLFQMLFRLHPQECDANRRVMGWNWLLQRENLLDITSCIL